MCIKKKHNCNYEMQFCMDVMILYDEYTFSCIKNNKSLKINIIKLIVQIFISDG